VAAGDYASFARAISLFVPEDVDGAVERTHRNCAFSIYSRTLNRTPAHIIDGGRLRQGWQITVGVVPSGEPAGSSTPAAQLNAAKAVMRSSPAYSTIFITNNVPYGTAVEYGQYPKVVKLGTYLPKKRRAALAGRIGGARIKKRDADGQPSHVQFSEGGFSRKAPDGMVRVAFEEVAAIVETLAKQAAAGVDLSKV
jgi:hypothetical protein